MITRLKNFTAILVLVLVVSIISFIIARAHFLDNFSDQVDRFIYRASIEIFKRSNLTDIFLDPLNFDEYSIYQQRITALVNQGNLDVAFKELDNVVNDRRLAKGCNNLSYQLGKLIYLKDKNLERSIADTRPTSCGYGVLHGVLDTYFLENSESIEKMKNTCNRLVGIQSIECRHAVGHSMMLYSGGDIDQSLEICEFFHETSHRKTCALGVFHELYLPHEGHSLLSTQHLSIEEAVAICDSQREIYQPVCYKMVPSFYIYTQKNKSIDDLLSWCSSTKSSYWCFRGATLQYLQYFPGRSMIEKFCLSAEDKHLEACMDEMLYLNLRKVSKSDMRSICTEKLRTDQSTYACLKSINKDLDL